jgi:hypothetical protein
MLLDRYRQLLTSYVDGELSSRQRRQVARLLRRFPEARQLLQKLKVDSRTLRHLSCPPLPGDLSGPVLHKIADRRLTPGLRRIAKVSSPTSWMAPLGSWVTAAAVLLILGAASYLYFAAFFTHPAKPEMARRESVDGSSTSETNPEESPLPKQERPPPASRQPPLPKIDSSVAVKPLEGVTPRGDNPPPFVPDKPAPLSKEESALTGRLEMFHLDRVADMLPMILKLSDLEEEPPRKKLVAELRKDSNFRLELPCPNGTKVLERVQQAAKILHFALLIDKKAQERIELKWRTNYVLYIENITPEELTRFVRQIGSEDRKIATSKPAETQLDRLVLSPLTTQHRKELSALLGIDPIATGSLGTDVRRPLSEFTARQIGSTLAGQGSKPRSQDGKAAPKPPEHTALVLAYHPVRPSPGSEEIKRFLHSRKPARSGTVRVLIVLRG